MTYAIPYNNIVHLVRIIYFFNAKFSTEGMLRGSFNSKLKKKIKRIRYTEIF